MADRKNQKPSAPTKGNTTKASTSKSAAKPQNHPALQDHPALWQAVEEFIKQNACFASSIPIDAAMQELGDCTDIQNLFAIPMQHRIISMDVALRWMLFLHRAPQRAVEAGDEPFSKDVEFSADGALALIADVYDLGVNEAVYDFFDEDEAEEVDEEPEESEE
jgi:hypothetical protein